MSKIRVKESKNREKKVMSRSRFGQEYTTVYLLSISLKLINFSLLFCNIESDLWLNVSLKESNFNFKISFSFGFFRSRIITDKLYVIFLYFIFEISATDYYN